MTEEGELQVYMTLLNSGNKVFVKGYQFFIDQGGLKEKWGKNWKPVMATSIEEARKLREKEEGLR